MFFPKLLTWKKSQLQKSTHSKTSERYFIFFFQRERRQREGVRITKKEEKNDKERETRFYNDLLICRMDICICIYNTNNKIFNTIRHYNTVFHTT
uniref:Ovule protein n=1 Tax=Ascaris lumbricoides TaxID=6252 RepID=A0A0M3IW85_ASCLU